ncbi:hypothetical protein BJ741DRAFT_121965 [Chytriomyces cf. hyalinus JEL632]|nr:hypothetical protein BJ741DRAFT_121965 [Chytriomyces cf. hyalinus JEL632]
MLPLAFPRNYSLTAFERGIPRSAVEQQRFQGSNLLTICCRHSEETARARQGVDGGGGKLNVEPCGFNSSITMQRTMQIRRRCRSCSMRRKNDDAKSLRGGRSSDPSASPPKQPATLLPRMRFAILRTLMKFPVGTLFSMLFLFYLCSYLVLFIYLLLL